METVLQQVERAPIIVAPIHAAPSSPQDAAKGHRTVTMEFPKPVHLTVSTNHSIFYPAGVQEVPEPYADHWYLKAHQVRPYYKPVQIGQQASAPPQSGRQRRNNNGNR